MTEVDCSKVYVDTSSFSSYKKKFLGAFAKVDIERGELVEKGIVRRLGECICFDGMNNPYVFTWSNNIPNFTWAFASGCATFYNATLKEDSNTHVIRFYSDDRFEIYATKDIKAGDELTYTYKSLKWRTSFIPLYKSLKLSRL